MLRKLDVGDPTDLRLLGFLPIDEAAEKLGMEKSTLYGYKKQKNNAKYQKMFLQIREKSNIWVDMFYTINLMLEERNERIESAKAGRHKSDR